MVECMDGFAGRFFKAVERDKCGFGAGGTYSELMNFIELISVLYFCVELFC